MTLKRLFLILGTVLLAAVYSCTPITLVRFDVPNVVLSDSVFEVVVEGTVSTNGTGAGCILQIPLGFVVESALAYQNLSGHAITLQLQQDFAGINALVATEAGHYATSFSQTTSTAATFGPTSLRVRVRARRQAGAASIKIAPVSFASGVWSQVAPFFSNFANAPVATHVRAFTVSSDPLNIPAWRNNTAGIDLSGTVQSNPIYENAYRVRVADMDQDGVKDMVFARGVLGGGMAPQFRPQAFINFASYRESSTVGFPSPTSTMRHGIDIGDLDADGDIDMIAAPFAIFINSGNGAFSLEGISPQMTIIPEFSPDNNQNDAAMAMGDLNGDGRAELVLARQGIGVFMYSGAGTLTPSSVGLPALPFSTSGTGDLDLQDMDGDGDLDIIGAFGSLLQVYTNLGNATWATGPAHSLPGLSIRRFAISDLDGDGDLDVAAVAINPGLPNTSFAGRVVVLHRSPMGFSELTLPGNNLLVSPIYREIAAGDLDQDGIPELITARALNPAVSPYHGELRVWTFASGSYQQSLALESGLPTGAVGDVSHMEVADQDDDGVLDLVINSSTRLAAYTRLTPQKGAWQGTVLNHGTGGGGPIPILQVNGDFGLAPKFGVEVPAFAPITLSLNPPSQGSGSGFFLLYGKLGTTLASDAFPSPIGFLPFLPPVLAQSDPTLFLIANSFDPSDNSALLPGAFPGPWNITYPPGLPALTIISFSAIVVDLTSPLLSLSISNSISVHTE